MSALEDDQPPPRLTAVTVRNYRVLRQVTMRDLTPMTVLLGPNGSGKSTVFDVFAFLSECFADGLRRAWDRRGRFRELRSRGADGPIVIELRYREVGDQPPVITYHLEIDERLTGPVVTQEWLRWTRHQRGRPFDFMRFVEGRGMVVSGELPDESAERVEETLDSPETLAVSTLGQLARHPRVVALRRFITGWYLSYLTADQTRGQPEAGPQERLSRTGDNLPNVIQYLKERHPHRLDEILGRLAARVPLLNRVDAETMPDGRLLLQLVDRPFERPILSRFASDGTLKLLAYLTVLRDPHPAPLIGIEEPENQLHPRLLAELAEECDAVASRAQLLVTTHSPFFINPLTPRQVWVLDRGDDGFARVARASEMPRIDELHGAGGLLGYLWMEGFFTHGDPLERRP